MKKTILIVLLLLLIGGAKAQTATADSVYVSVEQEPEFPGGAEGFTRYLSSVTRYPDSAFKHHVEGRVFVQMTIERDGTVTNSKIIRSVSPDIDAEALRVVNSSPRWKPGFVNGRPVRVNYTIPIKFSLAGLLKTDDTTKVNPQTFRPVEQVPEFPGGIEAFGNYLIKNLRYPESAREKNVQGRVIVTFVVERDGSLTGVKVARSLSRETDTEALRLIKASPKWKPGLQDGNPVRVQYSVPVQFVLGN